MGFSFIPFRVTTDQIVVAPPPSDIVLVGSEFTVRPVKFGLPNIYFIKTNRGYILVDTGMPNPEETLDFVFKKAAVDPKSVEIIILTHGHLDHVGNIAYAKRKSGAKVLCHQSFSESLEKGEIEPAIARDWLSRFLNFIISLAGTKFEGVKPDIVVEDELDLHEFGVSGKIIHTPGHSSSSISIVLDNGEALIGDIVRGEESGEIVIGNFYEDETVLLESLRKVAALEPKVIYLSHGNHIDNLTLHSVIDKLVMESGV